MVRSKKNSRYDAPGSQLGAAHHDMAEVSPVRLSLVPWKGLQL